MFKVMSNGIVNNIDPDQAQAYKKFILNSWERSGSVVECLRDRGAAGSSLTGVTSLCP